MQSTYDKIQYYKIDLHQKEALASKLEKLLAKENAVKLAWVFGSFTRREKIRDIAIAIYAEPELSFNEYLTLNADLELELGLPVDLVEITKAPAELRQRICEGTIIKGTKAMQDKLKISL
jgi:Predicted nucleotidyltransferases